MPFQLLGKQLNQQVWVLFQLTVEFLACQELCLLRNDPRHKLLSSFDEVKIIRPITLELVTSSGSEDCSADAGTFLYMKILIMDSDGR